MRGRDDACVVLRRAANLDLDAAQKKTAALPWQSLTAHIHAYACTHACVAPTRLPRPPLRESIIVGPVLLVVLRYANTTGMACVYIRVLHPY
jgi:hypothetical protein